MNRKTTCLDPYTVWRSHTRNWKVLIRDLTEVWRWPPVSLSSYWLLFNETMGGSLRSISIALNTKRSESLQIQVTNKHGLRKDNCGNQYKLNIQIIEVRRSGKLSTKYYYWVSGCEWWSSCSQATWSLAWTLKCFDKVLRIYTTKVKPPLYYRIQPLGSCLTNDTDTLERVQRLGTRSEVVFFKIQRWTPKRSTVFL